MTTKRVLLFVLLISIISLNAFAFTVSNATQVIDTLQAANAASAPFNPYAGPIAAGLSSLSALLSVIVGAVIHRHGSKRHPAGN